MLGMFFFMSLYMQDVLRYDALQAGVRFLPTTLMVIVVAPIAGRLTDRIGPRPLITLGLVLVAGSLLWQSFLTMGTGYGFLVGGFVVMGVGIALVMSPMSTAAMNAVDMTKAGVASGILSMSRMVGGTLGIAVLGTFIAGTVTPTAYVDALGNGMLLGAIVAAAGAVVAWLTISPHLAGGLPQAPPAGDIVSPPAEPAAQEPVRA